MRYHYERPEAYSFSYGETYICNHPFYNSCTLFTIGNKGLAVIQQRFDERTKQMRWTEIDPWLTDAIYLNPGFKEFFDQRADKKEKGLYPTITVRQLMWALRMKPLPKEKWETVFDRTMV